MGSFITLDINSLTSILKTCHNCPTGNLAEVNAGEFLAARIRGDLDHNIIFICCGLNINPEGAIFWHSEEVNPGDSDSTDCIEQNEITHQEPIKNDTKKIHRREVKEVLVKCEMEPGMSRNSMLEETGVTVTATSIDCEKDLLSEELRQGNVTENRIFNLEKNINYNNRLSANDLKNYPVHKENGIIELCSITDSVKNSDNNVHKQNNSAHVKNTISNRRNRKDNCLPLVTVGKSLKLKGQSKPSKHKKYPDIFTCEYCAKEFVGKDRAYQFYLHRNREHTQEMVYKCQMCSKTFWGDRELLAHEATHTGPGHICHICGQTFKVKKYLEVHVLTHMPEKPYTCKVCEKAFKRKDHLKVHERIHTGEHPYQCEWCGSAYPQRVQLGLHVQKCPTRKFQEEQQFLNKIQISF